MSRSSEADRVLAETVKLREEFDRAEEEDTAAARRAEASRPVHEMDGMPRGAELMALETIAVRGFSFRRNRWPELVAIEERVAGLERRQTEVSAELRELHEKLAAAPARDADVLARWQLDGAKGQRPTSDVPDLEQAISERQADFDALTRAIGTVLEGKAHLVDRHRSRLSRDAQLAVDAKHAELVATLDQAQRLREELAELQAEAVAVRLFPQELATQTPPANLLTGGLKQPAHTLLGVSHQLQAARVFDVLRADASWLKSAATPAQRAAIEGRDPRQPGGTIWADSDEGQEQLRKERAAARERHEAERTRTRAEWT